MHGYTAVSSTKNRRRWGPKGKELLSLAVMSSPPLESKTWHPRLEETYDIIVSSPFIWQLWRGSSDPSKVHNVRSSFVKSGMELQFPALAIYAYSTTTVLANTFYFLCQFWLIGGDCLELRLEDSVCALFRLVGKERGDQVEKAAVGGRGWMIGGGTCPQLPSLKIMCLEITAWLPTKTLSHLVFTETSCFQCFKPKKRLFSQEETLLQVIQVT